jgi:tellurite resistance protein TehA-like permease
MMGPGAYYLESLPYRLAPVWVPVYWCVVALNVVQLVWIAYSLFRGRWQKPQRARHLVYNALGMVPVILLLTVPDHVTILLKHPALDQIRYGATLDVINTSINWSVALICAIAGFQLVWGIIQLILNVYRKRAAAHV